MLEFEKDAFDTWKDQVLIFILLNHIKFWINI